MWRACFIAGAVGALPLPFGVHMHQQLLDAADAGADAGWGCAPSDEEVTHRGGDLTAHVRSCPVGQAWPHGHAVAVDGSA